MGEKTSLPSVSSESWKQVVRERDAIAAAPGLGEKEDEDEEEEEEAFAAVVMSS